MDLYPCLPTCFGFYIDLPPAPRLRTELRHVALRRGARRRPARRRGLAAAGHGREARADARDVQGAGHRGGGAVAIQIFLKSLI